MKKWKIIRNITLALLVCFMIFAGYIIINGFLAGNYYDDIFGVTIFYWFQHVWVFLCLYLYVFGIPLLIDFIILMISIIRIKKLSKSIIEK